MSKSIISNERECLVCGDTRVLHKHHIYEGVGRRQMSEKFGCWCYLCPRHHNMSDVGVHNNKTIDLKLKRYCQKVFEKTYSRDEFRRYFGSSYLEEDDDSQG